MTKPEPHPTSIPASAAYTILEGFAATLAAFHRKTEDFPLHAAGVVFQHCLGEARKEAALTPAEDEAFCHLRDRFHEVWKSFENPS